METEPLAARHAAPPWPPQPSSRGFIEVGLGLGLPEGGAESLWTVQCPSEEKASGQHSVLLSAYGRCSYPR